MNIKSINLSIINWKEACVEVTNRWDCDIVESEFELQSHNDVHFRTNDPWE